MRSESEHSPIGGDCLYKIAHSWLDPVVNPVQTALGCPLRLRRSRTPLTGLSIETLYWPRFGGAFFMPCEGDRYTNGRAGLAEQCAGNGERILTGSRARP